MPTDSTQLFPALLLALAILFEQQNDFALQKNTQERNEQEGKVAAIRSLQQWRLTDVELHNFLNR